MTGDLVGSLWSASVLVPVWLSDAYLEMYALKPIAGQRRWLVHVVGDGRYAAAHHPVSMILGVVVDEHFRPCIIDECEFYLDHTTGRWIGVFGDRCEIILKERLI